MKKSIVALVGRPNVGKSTLFNAILGERISIVHDTPGITRDRIYGDASWAGREFTLIDTGGIEPYDDSDMLKAMRRQAEQAIANADVIVFLVDLKSGLVAADREIAVQLRRSGKTVLLAVNKSDQIGEPPAEVYEFYQLALGEIFCLSAEHRLGIGELLDAVVDALPEEEEIESEEYTSIAIIGKPNVGKSSLVNYLTGEERTIVSDVAGTTRDALDIDITYRDKPYRLIDTAGLRRRGKISDKIEKYSVLRTLAAVERAKVCLILIDAEQGVTEQDTKAAGIAHNAGKASVIVVNKWDLIAEKQAARDELLKDIKRRFAFMEYAPVAFISAKTGLNLPKLFKQIDLVAEEADKRLVTGVINDVLAEAVALNQPPQDKGRMLKIYYATQVASAPPTIVLFVNDKQLTHFSYDRYLINRFRENFGFEGSPIRLIWRNRKKDEQEIT